MTDCPRHQPQRFPPVGCELRQPHCTALTRSE